MLLVNSTKASDGDSQINNLSKGTEDSNGENFANQSYAINLDTFYKELENNCLNSSESNSIEDESNFDVQKPLSEKDLSLLKSLSSDYPLVTDSQNNFNVQSISDIDVVSLFKQFAGSSGKTDTNKSLNLPISTNPADTNEELSRTDEKEFPNFFKQKNDVNCGPILPMGNALFNWQYSMYLQSMTTAFHNSLMGVTPFLQQPFLNNSLAMNNVPQMSTFKSILTPKPVMNKVLKEKKVEEPLDLSTKSPVSFDPLENAMAFYRQLTGNSCDHFVSQLPIFTPPKLVNEGKPKTRQPATRAHLVKKAYTQENLEAAVDDIRTKKLGTRKASVVYGIPRSTLRNKIYKLETELAAKGMLDPESTSIIMRGKKQKVANQISQNSIESKPLCKNNSFENKRKTCSLETLANVVLSQSYHLDAPLRVMEMDGKSDYSPPSLLTNECDDSLSPSIKFSRESSTGKTMSNVSDSCMTTLEEFEGSLNKDKKKSRPKRGNYRRYNKDALDEAVKSVRLGEMSVHRAGSYFGVPHSTLEYKVKERKTKRSLKKCQGSEDDTNSFDGEKNEEEEDDGIFEVDELDFRLTPSKNERSLSLIHENLLIEY